MTTALSVNVNKIALVRNARGKNIPDVVHLSRIALEAGAHGITIHPRPDERHARRSDVPLLAALVAEFPDRELNIEGNPTPDFLDLVVLSRPHQCTLVPDAPDQITSDHGWNVKRDSATLAPIIARLRAARIRVSVFIDPDPAQAAPAKAVGADRVELYTESYANAYGTDAQATELARFVETANAAHAAGLGVNAGHDLSLLNLGPFCRAVPNVAEVSIGQALVADALELGLCETVRRYLALLQA